MAEPLPEDVIRDAIEKLGEHFDCVQILVSRVEEGGATRCCYRGSGNWYARQGMAHEFITADVAQENATQIAEQIRKNIPPNDEEEESN